MFFVISFVLSTFILLAITFSESIYLVLAFSFAFAVISQLSIGSTFHYKFRTLPYRACAYISITLSYIAWFCVLAHGFRTLHIALCALAVMSWLVTIFIGRK